MAVSGNRKKPAYLKAVTGNPGKRPIEDVDAPEIKVREELLEPPKNLLGQTCILLRNRLESACIIICQSKRRESDDKKEKSSTSKWQESSRKWIDEPHRRLSHARGLAWGCYQLPAFLYY